MEPYQRSSEGRSKVLGHQRRGMPLLDVLEAQPDVTVLRFVEGQQTTSQNAVVPERARVIPYRSQFASPDLIDDVVQRRRRVVDDPRWRESGAETAEEYALWAKAGCGMACLQMILGAIGVDPPPLVELARGCETYGGYRRRASMADGVDGLFYDGFVAYITDTFGLRARVAAPFAINELTTAVAGDEVVVASVHHGIRWPSLPPPSRGGHLVLVVDSDGDHIRFHNPSGHKPATQIDVQLPQPVFAEFYAHRGIAVTIRR